MKRQRLFLAAPLLGGALLLAACGGNTASASVSAPSGSAAPAAAGKGDPAKGKTLFTGTCAACHGPDAKGLPGLGKDLTTSAFTKSKSDADLVAFVKAGRPASDPANTTHVDMPPNGGNPSLTDAQLFDIVAYVRTLQK